MSYKEIMGKLYAKKMAVRADEIVQPPPIATPSPSVNWIMSGGIIPGRSYIFEGPFSSGKTMYTAACVGSLLRAIPDSVVFWFDSELTFSGHWLKVFMPDIDPERIPVIQTKRPAEIFDYFVNEIIPRVEEDGLKVVACVLDSISSIIPPKEQNKDSSEDAVYAALAGYLPSALRMIAAPSRKHDITWMFVSQVAENMDPSVKYTGEKYVIKGGQAFKHEVDVECQFTIVQGKDTRLVDETIKNMNETESRAGHTVRVRNIKNKTGIPYRIAEFKLNYQKGLVCVEEEIAKLGLNLGIISKDGNTYYFEGSKLAVGVAKTLEVIASSKAIQEEILKKVFEKDKKE